MEKEGPAFAGLSFFAHVRVFFDVAPKLLKPSEARLVVMARRCFEFQRAWPAGPEGYCCAAYAACNMMIYPPTLHFPSF